jgi:hypothetical protein
MSTPNLDLLKAEVAKLLAAGIEPSRVEDTIIGRSFEDQKLYERALAEFAAIPRMAVEGKATFRSGQRSPGGRRSVAGFRQHILDQEASP